MAVEIVGELADRARGVISPKLIERGHIVLALSQPDPEIEPVTALEAGAAIAVDGKSINNVLAFPGLVAGALRAGARSFDDGMYIAAAEALAKMAPEGQLVPDPLNAAAHEAVASAVAAAAVRKSAAGES